MNDNAGSTINLFGDSPSHPRSLLSVAKLSYVDDCEIEWRDLFGGYRSLKVVTYSSSVSFMQDLFAMFDDVEVILGSDRMVQGQLHEIMAFQQATVNEIREMLQKKSNAALFEMVQSGRLRFLVSREYMSHEKLFLLSGDHGNRVVMGSANMSYMAFSGRQRENICYLDDKPAYEYYLFRYDQLKASCTDEVDKALLKGEEDQTDAPVLRTATKRLIVVEAADNPEARREVTFTLNVDRRKRSLSAITPSKQSGRIHITADEVKKIRRQIKQMQVEVSSTVVEHPRLVIDVDEGTATLNDRVLELTPAASEVQSDVRYLIEYMEGFKNFHGDTAEMIRRYYAFVNWIFVSPFMAVMRDTAQRNHRTVYPYPVFGLLYGKSKGGKTSFLETIIMLMTGQKLTLSGDKFTRTNINDLKHTVQGVPIVIDDLTQVRFNTHAPEVIKNESFGLAEGNRHYPAVVISANEDVNVVLPEIARRTVTCHIQAGRTTMEIMRSSLVQRVQAHIGTALYRAYLGEMLKLMPTLLDELKSAEHGNPPDILQASSLVLQNIVQECLGEVHPHSFVRELSLEDYFDDQKTRRSLIEQINNDYRLNPKSFTVVRGKNELIYDTRDQHTARRILKELPEDLLAKQMQTKLSMNLTKAQEFFGCDFSRPWYTFR